jgi:hypothetical protein
VKHLQTVAETKESEIAELSQQIDIVLMSNQSEKVQLINQIKNAIKGDLEIAKS